MTISLSESLSFWKKLPWIKSDVFGRVGHVGHRWYSWIFLAFFLLYFKSNRLFNVYCTYIFETAFHWKHCLSWIRPHFQMSLFGYQNKIRLCLTIFASLIFLDIVAFFDTLLSSIVSFQHFEEERPGVERENLTTQKRTENDRDKGGSQIIKMEI